jgi:hypothetical protein
MKGWKETKIRMSPVKGSQKEGICTKCLKWPCDFIGNIIDTKKEKVTWCKDILKRGGKNRVGS